MNIGANIIDFDESVQQGEKNHESLEPVIRRYSDGAIATRDRHLRLA